ncbi:MAG: 4Fe-4S dicluster domain-containing protein [Lentimicrobiaceae bacterium]|nr:4Fe-4S dicluster domain-containing protein [Lentimicrobiaceae bacterium]
MSYQIYQTDKAGLAQFYENIIGKNETYAPVLNFEKYEYKKVSKLADCNPESPIVLTMSMKPLFFPKNSAILKYKESSEGTEIIPDAEDDLAKKRVVLGVKHCDARALQVLDKVYQWDYHDEDYRKRRENTLIISTRCEKAGAHCFCTSLDYDVENSDAYDVMVVKAADGNYYLQAHTDKGDAFLKENTGKLAANDGIEKIKEQYTAFAASFALKMNYEEVSKRLNEQFDSSEFENATSNCISCNTCSFICPTCHCFKISDEKIKDKGIRYKAYDSCNSPYFTLMAGGHNPRPVKYRRWRQRAMHKFVYYKERFDVNLCVGCGKCAISCPVNIHIFDVVNQVANKA